MASFRLVNAIPRCFCPIFLGRTVQRSFKSKALDIDQLAPLLGQLSAEGKPRATKKPLVDQPLRQKQPGNQSNLPLASQTDEITKKRSFSDWTLNLWLLNSLTRLGMMECTSIQRVLFEKMFYTKQDLMIQAMTGTGKSLGYLIAILNNTNPVIISRPTIKTVQPARWSMQTLIIVPNCLLGLQLVRWIKKLLDNAGANERPTKDINDLVRLVIPKADESSVSSEFGTASNISSPGHASVLIGTPSALYERLSHGLIDISELCTIIVDEADQMARPLSQYAQRGEKLKKIKHPDPLVILLKTLTAMEKRKQKSRAIVVSATLTGSVRNLFRRNLGVVNRDVLILQDTKENPRGQIACPQQIVHQHRLLEGEHADMDTICQAIVNIVEEKGSHKNRSNYGNGIVFVPARESKSRLCEWLINAGITNCKLLSTYSDKHSSGEGCNQDNVLWIGSDVDARGLDIPALEFVIIVGLPLSDIDYVHMAGRVGRMGRQGTVHTLLRSTNELKVFMSMSTKLKFVSLPPYANGISAPS